MGLLAGFAVVAAGAGRMISRGLCPKQHSSPLS